MAVGICIVLGLSSDPLSSQGILGGMETTGWICQIEVTENSLFYCNQIT
jgi:hypothetical protein